MADRNAAGGPPEQRRRSLFSPRDKLKPVAAPPPPAKPKKRGGGIVGTLSAFLTVSVLLLVGVALGVGYFKSVVSAPGPLQSDRAVVIQRGAGSDEIAELLEREGVINRRVTFELLAYSHIYGRLKAGEFLFRREASLKDVIDTIANGRAIEHAITIPEGLTSEQIVARIRDNELLVGSVGDVPPEGSMLPDTYKIARGTSRDSLLARMTRDHKRLLADIWAKRAKDLPVRSPQDLVTLASIIEKETGKQDERTRVAGVFVNRLNRGMKLQSDPTIIYGLVAGKGTLGRPITTADIQSTTAYNTYVIPGLPPGPIANPGRASLEAAANPSRTRDLFFVADGTGGHAFAETLEQHNRNVARWRQIEAQQKAAASAPPLAAPGTVGAPAFAPVSPVNPSIAPNTRGEAAPAGQPSAPAAFAPLPPAQGETTATVRPQAAQPPLRRGVVNDASQGTRRDPLANRNFDLNSPQTVPALR